MNLVPRICKQHTLQRAAIMQNVISLIPKHNFSIKLNNNNFFPAAFQFCFEYVNINLPRKNKKGIYL